MCPTVKVGMNISFPKKASFRGDMKQLLSQHIGQVCVILMSKLLLKYFGRLKDIEQQNLRQYFSRSLSRC